MKTIFIAEYRVGGGGLAKAFMVSPNGPWTNSSNSLFKNLTNKISDF